MKIYAAYKKRTLMDSFGPMDIDDYYEFFESELDCLRYCINSNLSLKCKEIIPLPDAQKIATNIDEKENIIIPTPLSRKADSAISYV